MALDLEWRNRFNSWKAELGKHFYKKLGSVALEAYFTKDLLAVQDVRQESFRSLNIGDLWGEKWEYGWFRGNFVLPGEAEGKSIVFCADIGAEAIVYVNGDLKGAKDRQHWNISIDKHAKTGKQYDVLIEAYAGHGAVSGGNGPVSSDRERDVDIGKQAVIGDTSFGIFQEEVFQLWMDVETLYQVRENIDENSLRVAEIDKGLKDFTKIVDFELPNDDMLATVSECRKRLAPLFECTNGSTTPEMFAFGHSHIDVAWLWPINETIRKCARTFSNQIALIEEYPEYKFLQSQPHLYKFTEKYYPELYGKVKEWAARGNFCPEGAMWVEADTNIPSGESLVRQMLYGKRFFKDEFGVDCELLWLPDVFGYSGALPQIMAGCEIQYFSTHKIFWLYNGGDPFPYNTFIWKGIDGTEIKAHFHEDYNAKTEPKTIIGRWNNRVQKDGFSARLFPFGHGDGGGGATREHLEFVKRLKNLEGVPKVRMCNPLDFFKAQDQEGWPDAVYVGELYFQNHRGTYTSQAKTKLGNRKSEFSLREAELWGSIARITDGYIIPTDELARLWENVLLNQFHDIIPGSSIGRVYEEAEADYERIVASANSIARDAVSRIASGSSGITVFNSLSWSRNAIIELPEGLSGASDCDGNPLPSQRIGDSTFVETEIPSCGWITLMPAKPNDLNSAVSVSEKALENEYLRLELNEKGEITSIYDKESGKELSRGFCNSFQMYKDVPSAFDAWDLDRSYKQCHVALPENAKISVTAKGPLLGTVHVERILNNSLMSQDIIVRKGSRVIEFKTKVDWKEKHKLLKVSFPVDYHTDELISEIQFGHIKRPNHASRQYDADRFEVSNHKWSALMETGRGFAVMNDCKYGIDADGCSINLTLLKSAVAPDEWADIGVQEFTYAAYFWNESFVQSNLIQKSYELNCPVITASGSHSAPCASVFSVDNPNIIIETIKPAEDGSGDIVLRLYESKATASHCVLSTLLPYKKVIVTNMLEKELSELKSDKIEVCFRPFEIKTLRLSF